MLDLVRNLSISGKLATMLAAPLLALVLFAGSTVLDKRDTAASTSSLQELAELGVKMSNYVHESQKERGRTGVFVGSKGAKGGAELAEQRKLTDAQLATMTAALQDFDASEFGPQFARLLGIARNDFVAKLADRRKTVDALAIEGAPAVGYYTQMNGAIIDVIARIAHESDEAELSRAVSPYVSFMRAKEKTGVERANMANAFAGGRFADAEQIEKFLGAVSAQEAFLHDFELTATPEALRFYERTVSGPAVESAQEMREVALGHLAADDLGGVDAVAWYEAMTAKIDLMKKVEDRLAGDLQSKAASLKSDARSSLVLAAIVSLLALALTVGLAVFLARGIRRGVSGILERLRTLRTSETASLRLGLEAMAAGDLTVEASSTTPPIERTRGDEIGDLEAEAAEIRDATVSSLTAYNETRQALGQLIGRVSETASGVSAASQEMAATSEEAGRAVGEIVSAVGEVAAGAERQVGTVQSARETTDEMATASQASAENARETARSADAARSVASEGVEAVAHATEAMQAVRESSAAVTDAIRELGLKSEQIGGIVDTITRIAGQTNLLALNAAIEAARAGEQGRGFAVVAEQVRTLAEESKEAAERIAGLIDEIQSETAKAVDVVEAGAERTDRGAATVEQARASFERIGCSVEDMTARVEQIADAIRDIAAGSARMAEDMNEVAAVAEESSASTQQVSASTEQTSASTQQLAGSAQQLASSADELERLVGQFTLR